MESNAMTSASAIAKGLVKLGVERVYGIVGTSNVAFLDALFQERESLRYISCRHEQVAASIADAEGRLTGKPGVVLVHSGPGALNAMISVANAFKDSSPMVVIAGAVKRRLVGSDGMLEVNHCRVFSPITKATYRIENASEVPEVLCEAFSEAASAPRGPVLIEVPEDVWLETGTFDLEAIEPNVDEGGEPSEEEVTAAIEMLRKGDFPLILSGGGVAYSGASVLLTRFAEALSVPVITTGNGRGTIPEDHPLSLGRAGFGGGNLVADKALEKSDALLCLGAGISDMTTYEFTLPLGNKEIFVVDVSGKVAPQAPKCHIAASNVASFLEKALLQLGEEGCPSSETWVERELSQEKTQWEELVKACLNRGDKPAGGRAVQVLGETLPENAIVCVGAGMHLLYPNTFIKAKLPLSYLSTVNFGSMGFCLAACMAANLVYPQRKSVAIVGDGDIMMTIQDLETCARENIPVKVFILNDFCYRVLVFRQKLQFGGRIYGTGHSNPDFVEVAQSFGGLGLRIKKASEMEGVIRKALEHDGMVLVDVQIDPDDLPPMNIEANLRMSAGP
ncbi:MAG: thiamine pyrophosphate-binding protein [Actinomycetota bacterium]|nr:thiamine pyrophosphate-binding protein [Actinomycetota bacterium]